MDLELNGKVAVVTGASRGIGKGIAQGLLNEGCHLVICARGEEALNQTAAELRENDREVTALPMDVTVSTNIIQLKQVVEEKYGGIDILVNNVGGNKRGLFEDTTDQDWQRIIDINFLSHVNISRAFIPLMKQKKKGSIVFISSIFGRESGGATLSLYNTTKSALISLSKIMATELAPDGIRVNSVAPGSIRFPGGSWDRRCKENPQAMAEFIQKELPIGRFGTVEEVANVVCFLASDRASLVTGTCLNVDGGQSRSLI